MKLASYIVDGQPCFGAVIGDGVLNLNQRLGHRYATLRDALAGGALADIRKAAEAAKPDHRFTDVKWLPVIPNPEKILCAGINYRSHAAETGREVPKQPSMFIRLATTLTGHEGEMIRPSVSQSFDFEGELAVVIGRGGRHIPVARALEHVAGYTCFVDGSVRDYQKISVTSGKNFPATGPLGPWIVTADEIGDPHTLGIRCQVNGVVRQNSNTRELVFSVYDQIAHLTQVMTLEPGDVIFTGTPGGVGAAMKPPGFLKPGDTVCVDIDKIGTLIADVRRECD
jgi:2-keto-4-pentenoate hydratase/2-oxohepta-3-ene-1,7-dioic acid hydratase in catechol pathway